MEASISDSRSDKIFRAVGTTVLALLLVLILYPLYFILIASVSDVVAVNSGQVLLLPKGLHLSAYHRVFLNENVLTGYRNTIIYATLGTVINLALTLTAGYALSVKFPGRNIAMFLIVFTMFFSGGIIPLYLVVRSLGIIDSIWAMVLPVAVNAYNLIITRTFITVTIPVDLYDAARVDGLSRLQYFRLVVLPLSSVIIAILTLFYAVDHWNAYFHALIFLTSRDLFPLQIVLREIVIQSNIAYTSVDDNLSDPESITALQNAAESLKYALIVVSSLPVLVLYPFVQKHFAKGVMIGSIKG